MRTADERAAHWKANHDFQVELKQKQHAMVVRLREAIYEIMARLEAEATHPSPDPAHTLFILRARLSRAYYSPNGDME